MKNLKKHPKQQRMEDMTFPLQKGDYTGGIHKKRSGNTLKLSDFSSDRYEDMTFPITKMGKKMNKIIAKAMEVETSSQGSKLTLDKLEAIEKDMRKVFKEDMTDKVIWEGREWLRSINDDRHGWHVLGWVILGVAVIISLKIVL